MFGWNQKQSKNYCSRLAISATGAQLQRAYTQYILAQSVFSHICWLAQLINLPHGECYIVHDFWMFLFLLILNSNLRDYNWRVLCDIGTLVYPWFTRTWKCRSAWLGLVCRSGFCSGEYVSQITFIQTIRTQHFISKKQINDNISNNNLVRRMHM